MRWNVALTALALVFLATTAAPAQTSGANKEKGKKQNGSKSQEAAVEARAHYLASQAALMASMSQAEALLRLSETENYDDDLAHSHEHSANRDANSANTESVKMGQARPELEKEKSLKEYRKHLDEAIKATTEAASAIDGHGKLADPAKKLVDHLHEAMKSLVDLSKAADAKPLSSPGAQVIEQNGGKK